MHAALLSALFVPCAIASAKQPPAKALADSAYALLEVNPSLAMELAQRAYAAAAAAGDDVVLHDALNSIRYVHYLKGRHAELLERSVEALSVAQRMGSVRAIGDDHGWISVAYLASGQNELGFEHAGIALQHMRATGDTSAITRGLTDMANACNITKRHAEAVKHITEAIGLYEAQGDSSGASFARNLLGAFHMERKRWSDALPYLVQAHRHIGAHGTDVERIWSEGDLARTYAHLGLFDKARMHLERAERICGEVGATRELPRVLHTRIAYHELRKEYREALAACRRLVELNDSLAKAEVAESMAQSALTHELDRARGKHQDLARSLADASEALHARERARNLGFAAAIILLAALLAMVAVLWRARREAASLRQQLDEALDENDRLRGYKPGHDPIAMLRKVK